MSRIGFIGYGSLHHSALLKVIENPSRSDEV